MAATAPEITLAEGALCPSASSRALEDVSDGITGSVPGGACCARPVLGAGNQHTLVCLAAGLCRELFSALVLSCLMSGTRWRELSFKSGSVPGNCSFPQLGLVQPSREFHRDRAEAALGACPVIPWGRDPWC